MDHKPLILKQTSNKVELTNWETFSLQKKEHIIHFKIV